MLIKCPECELQVSDKALVCPHCGLPMAKNIVPKRAAPGKKRRALPNGFGQISEMKDQFLRKRFRAMVSVGKRADGRPIVRPLKPQSYFATYNEAYEALVEYNRNPYDLDKDITVKELYEKWSEWYFQTLKSNSSQRTIRSCWAYCSAVYDMRVKDLRPRHIKGCMEEGTAFFKGEIHTTTPNKQERIKSMFNLMLDYAMEHEIVTTNYARTFDVSSEVMDAREEMRRGHIAFTDQEMDALWHHLYAVRYVDVLLIQCYAGWRPQELGMIRLENVDLEHWFFRGGMKTTAGINRKVPIHTKIRPLVERAYADAEKAGSEYLFICNDAYTHKGSLLLTYDRYATRFQKVINELGLNTEHKPHDPRKQFVTMAKKAKVDEYALKYMVGHQINDITEKVYTERDDSWLAEEIEKIR